MDVLPPELWGVIQQYIDVSRYNYAGLYNDVSPCSRGVALALLSAELTTWRGEQKVLLTGMDTCDNHYGFERLHRLAQLPCDIALSLHGERRASLFCELVHSLADANAMCLMRGLLTGCQRERSAGRDPLPQLAPTRLEQFLDFGLFKDIHRITIQGCNVLDVGALRHVPHVELAECPRLADISLLGSQQSVVIDDCPVVDVSSLARVPSVTLRCCRMVKDVSSLGGQRKLVLCDCPGVADFGSLTRVGYLHIWRADALTVLPAMENEHLILEKCDQLHDISQLKSVGTLVIRFSAPPDLFDPRNPFANPPPPHALAGTGSLSRVRDRIELSSLDIRDLRPLGGAKTVDLEDCPRVYDVAPLGNCRAVRLCQCPGVTDVAPLKNVRDVRIERCENVADLSELQGFRELTYAANPYRGVPLIFVDEETSLVVIPVFRAARDATLQHCYRLSCVADARERAVLAAAYPKIRHLCVAVTAARRVAVTAARVFGVGN